MIPGLILFFVIAILDWVSVARGWKRVEYFVKPLTMLILLALLLLQGGFRSMPILWFSIGIFLSLAGDIFLMVNITRVSGRWLMLGIGSFLLAHVAYIIGLNTPLPDVSPVWSIGLAILLGLTASRILRRVITGVRKKGLHRLVIPVAAYGIVITLMLLSALLTLYRSDWLAASAGLVSLGAVLFYLSDLMLAWNRYVNPVRGGRLVNMITYHLGQMALVVGILIQFG